MTDTSSSAEFRIDFHEHCSCIREIRQGVNVWNSPHIDPSLWMSSTGKLFIWRNQRWDGEGPLLSDFPMRRVIESGALLQFSERRVTIDMEREEIKTIMLDRMGEADEALGLRIDPAPERSESHEATSSTSSSSTDHPVPPPSRSQPGGDASLGTPGYPGRGW